MTMKKRAKTTTADSRKVTGMAMIALAILRDNRVPDDEILEHYAVPCPEADRTFEAMQIAQRGHIYAPALAVKAELRRLLAN
jgi:hypothetical protein